MQAGNKLKKVAILQSNYVPWKGYFDMIAAVDEFIIYDDVQFTKNDWRNRNKIKANGQVQWLTIPVRHSISDRIRDVKVSLDNWNIKHWKTLQANYGRALAFRDASDFLEELYRAPRSAYLSEINVEFIRAINSFLGIDTRVTWSSDYEYGGERSERVLALCKAAGANSYLSGPAAKSYLDLSLFEQEEITVEWMDYSGYPEYPQMSGSFDHAVSILDLIFNTGSSAGSFMKFVK
ncbi:MAG: WbqC family protein [Nitrosomonas sp.]|uniref:WbqC family protein n=1 Tax=Nitrosomonas sp. TaxID=42353 RepID=UPI0025D53600|nr:WbqC family protein [Nitrosomonas sp.]